jgi:hypothetical protein
MKIISKLLIIVLSLFLVTSVSIMVFASPISQFAFVSDDPSVSVADQPVVDDYVSVGEVVSSGAGWIVIHNQTSAGTPGAVLGFASVSDGHNKEVRVMISQDMRTTNLYAMLHTDSGTVGMYEFPGADVPVKDASDNVIVSAFSTTGTKSSSVTVEDQTITDNNITVTEVVSPGAGWIVIHADNEGSPGAVLGQTAVNHGVNTDVAVSLATEGRTATLYAMLHYDNGTIGTYEFPGADTPVSDVSGNIIVSSFKANEATTSGFEFVAVFAGLLVVTVAYRKFKKD